MPGCDICWSCDGSGKRNPVSGERCLVCDGTGVIEEDDLSEEDYAEELFDPYEGGYD